MDTCVSQFQLNHYYFQGIIAEIDEDGNGEMSFEEFAHLAARFLVEEDEDTEAILKELKDAFRLYDKEGKQNNDLRQFATVNYIW